ncbi:MAG: hypothetical protein JW797_03105, partial [Bradymonadales bacterium]|nr:hypothetical protein [Bradymonadales bacterium]
DCFDSVCCVPAVDQTSPIPIVQAIFDAAQSEDFTPLAGLCDPADEGDGDTRAICQLAYDTRGAPDFIEYFQKGSVSGEAVIQGDQASVPILFGPDGTRSETMQLIRREGLWYLFSF